MYSLRWLVTMASMGLKDGERERKKTCLKNKVYIFSWIVFKKECSGVN
jgi:hypothetical protein